MTDERLATEAWTTLDFSPDDFRRYGHQVVEIIADYYAGLNEYPVFPPRTSQAMAEVFDEPPPEAGQAPEEILREWVEKVLPNTTHLGSPRYFGFVNGSGAMMATLAEALAASVNMNPGAWKAAPAATEIERRTIAWIAELIGYPASSGGLFTSGGTMANFTALLTGLRNTAGYDTTSEGLQSGLRSGRFTLYMTDHEGHISITRAADMLNLGRSAVRRVPSREDLSMDVAGLERLLDEDADRGEVPFCVVAQVGSINVGVVDPLEEIADVCARRGLWFHGDGANGAFGAMLPEKRTLFKGLEKLDSLTLDPHKWLYVPYECGCVLVKDPEKQRRAFSIHAPYLRGSLPTQYTGLDYLEYGPQMSRGFRALKVWMTLKHYGAEGYRRLHRQNLRCVEHLDGRVRSASDFEAVHEPSLFIYSFRYVPEWYAARSDGPLNADEAVQEYLDALNQRIADEIQRSGVAFIMTSSLRGRIVLRMSVCSHRTTIGDIDLVFDTLRELGRRLDSGDPSSPGRAMEGS